MGSAAEDVAPQPARAASDSNSSAVTGWGDAVMRRRRGLRGEMGSLRTTVLALLLVAAGGLVDGQLLGENDINTEPVDIAKMVVNTHVLPISVSEVSLPNSKGNPVQWSSKRKDLYIFNFCQQFSYQLNIHVPCC